MWRWWICIFRCYLLEDSGWATVQWFLGCILGSDSGRMQMTAWQRFLRGKPGIRRTQPGWLPMSLPGLRADDSVSALPAGISTVQRTAPSSPMTHRWSWTQTPWVIVRRRRGVSWPSISSPSSTTFTGEFLLLLVDLTPVASGGDVKPLRTGVLACRGWLEPANGFCVKEREGHKVLPCQLTGAAFELHGENTFCPPLLGDCW